MRLPTRQAHGPAIRPSGHPAPGLARRIGSDGRAVTTGGPGAWRSGAGGHTTGTESRSDCSAASTCPLPPSRVTRPLPRPPPHPLATSPTCRQLARAPRRAGQADQGQARPLKRRDRPLKRGGRPGPRPAPSRSVATHVAESGVLRRRRLRRRPRGATRGVATAPDRCCAGRGTRGAGITAMALNRSSLPAFRATVRSVITGKSFEAPVHKKITLCC